MVARGRGLCRTNRREIRLGAGSLFSIPRDLEHTFSTSSEPLTMIVYHPSREIGSTDDAHPTLDPTPESVGM
jgi:mannose-6-phosphate isomerase-like protein (cupin superfamily)